MCKPNTMSDNFYTCNYECPVTMTENIGYCLIAEDFYGAGDRVSSTPPWFSNGYNTQPRSVTDNGHGYYNGKSTAAGLDSFYLPFKFL